MALGNARYEECIQLYERINPYTDPDDGYNYQDPTRNRHWWEFTHEVERMVKLRRRVRRLLTRFGTFEWRHLYSTVYYDTECTIQGQKRADIAALQKRVDAIIACAYAEEVKCGQETEEVTLIPDIVFQLSDGKTNSTKEDKISKDESTDLSINISGNIIEPTSATKVCTGNGADVSRSQGVLPDLVPGHTDSQRGEIQPDVQQKAQDIVPSLPKWPEMEAQTIQKVVVETSEEKADLVDFTKSTSQTDSSRKTEEASPSHCTTKVEVFELFEKTECSQDGHHQVSPPKSMMQVTDVEEMLENMIIQDIYDSPYVLESGGVGDKGAVNGKVPKESLYDTMAGTDSGHASDDEVCESPSQSITSAISTCDGSHHLTAADSIKPTEAVVFCTSQTKDSSYEEQMVVEIESSLTESQNEITEKSITCEEKTVSQDLEINTSDTMKHIPSESIDRLDAAMGVHSVLEPDEKITVAGKCGNQSSGKKIEPAENLSTTSSAADDAGKETVAMTDQVFAKATEMSIDGDEKLLGDDKARSAQSEAKGRRSQRLSDKAKSTNCDDAAVTDDKTNEQLLDGGKTVQPTSCPNQTSDGAASTCPKATSDSCFAVIQGEEVTEVTEVTDSVETSVTMTNTLSMTTSLKQDKKCALM